MKGVWLATQYNNNTLVHIICIPILSATTQQSVKWSSRAGFGIRCSDGQQHWVKWSPIICNWIDILLFMHMKCYVGIDNSKIMLQYIRVIFMIFGTYTHSHFLFNIRHTTYIQGSKYSSYSYLTKRMILLISNFHESTFTRITK